MAALRVRIAIAVMLAGAAGLAATTSASAAVTIGPASLDPDLHTVALVAQPTTLVSTAQTDGSSAGAPFDGVVVRWRAVVDPVPEFVGGTAALRVVRPLPIADNFLAIRSSAPVSAPTDAVEILSQTSRAPIRAGDAIGITLENGIQARLIEAQPSGQHRLVDGVLEDGTSGEGFPVVGSGAMAPVQADIEPDADGDRWGDESQDGCPTDANTHGPCGPETLSKLGSKGKGGKKIEIGVACPAGRVSDCTGEVAVRSRERFGKAKTQIAFGEAPYTVATGQTGTLLMRLTSHERKLLKKQKKIKVVARISPENGKSSALKGKLKRGKKKKG